jgi:hypothetical protein
VIDSAALSRTDSNEMPTAESASVPPNISITWARHGSRGCGTCGSAIARDARLSRDGWIELTVEGTARALGHASTTLSARLTAAATKAPAELPRDETSIRTRRNEDTKKRRNEDTKARRNEDTHSPPTSRADPTMQPTT